MLQFTLLSGSPPRLGRCHAHHLPLHRRCVHHLIRCQCVALMVVVGALMMVVGRPLVVEVPSLVLDVAPIMVPMTPLMVVWCTLVVPMNPLAVMVPSLVLDVAPILVPMTPLVVVVPSLVLGVPPMMVLSIVITLLLDQSFRRSILHSPSCSVPYSTVCRFAQGACIPARATPHGCAPLSSFLVNLARPAPPSGFSLNRATKCHSAALVMARMSSACMLMISKMRSCTDACGVQTCPTVLLVSHEVCI